MTEAWQRAMSDSTDVLAIRSAVAAARRIAPAADLDGVADFCIAKEAPLIVVKRFLFDAIVAAHASRPGETTFHRAPLAAIVGAARRRT